MSEVSKLINLLIEFEEKLQPHLNKKYKSFLRSVMSLDTLRRSIRAERPLIAKELMVFKLGLEAKSPKAVEISLSYLVKCLQAKFIDVSAPNLCEHYQVEQAGVKQVPVPEVKTQVRDLLIGLLKKNIGYKQPEICQLIVKVLELIISEPVLGILLELSQSYPQQATQQAIFNFFSFRFYVYQQICYYSQRQLQGLRTISIRSQRTQKQIKQALQQDLFLRDLLGKYMNEYLSIVDKSGGKYGSCVMCGQAADNYCRITKASLCGLDCKKKHIQMAERQYKHQFQAHSLQGSIETNFTYLLKYLQENESPLVFGVLTRLIDRPHLFMVIKHSFRAILAKHAPLVLNKALGSKNLAGFESIYSFVVSLAKYWLSECLSTVQFFFRDYIIHVFQEKKPSLRFLNLICKALAKLFENGKVTIQLYINFDCQVNRQNLIEKILFQIARIVQDRFGSGSHISKQERITLKNHYLSLLIILSMRLSQYRKQQSTIIQTLQIVELKQKKVSLEQFVLRFNEHWTSGLKTLFNLNLVGLDSNQEIVDIIMNLKGLSKASIEQLFFCEKGKQLFEILLGKIIHKHSNNLLFAILQLHHYLPLKVSSIGVKKLTDKLLEVKLCGQDVQLQTMKWTEFFSRNYGFADLSKQLAVRSIQCTQHQKERIYSYSLETKSNITLGNNKAYFTYCCSRSYLSVIANQIALLQIPLSYMLQTDFEISRIIDLIEELVQICAHSNWISLLIKNSSISKYPHSEFDEAKLKIVMGILDIVEKQAYFIQDWSTIIHFLSFLHNTIKKVKAFNDSKVILENQISVARIERCLIEASVKSEPHFAKFLLALLVVGKDEFEKQNLFMIQKFFEAIDRNQRIFITIAERFLPYLSNFVKNLKQTYTQGIISIADMLKQSFAKLLKMVKLGGGSWSPNTQSQFWRLFECLCNYNNKQVSDFVVNCVSMSVLNHYQLTYNSWTVLFEFMERKVKDYRNQFFTILQKIVNQKMQGCQEFYEKFIDITLEIIHPQETKISIQSLHLIRNSVQIISKFINIQEQSSQKQISQKKFSISQKSFKEMIKKIIKTLIQSLYYKSHEYVIQLLFKLLKYKINKDSLLDYDQVSQMLNYLFEKTQEYDKSTLQIAQKTVNYTLNWSILNQYSEIVHLLEGIITNKYNHLSLSAVKCLKTYIQIINPKKQQIWDPIQNSLLRILKDTRISNQIDLAIPNLIEQNPRNFELRDSQIRLNIPLFANKITVQKSIIDILPNHHKCIQQLLQLHQDVIKFNDNLYLHILLWRRGLGSHNTEKPPNLLKLQQTITSKIILTYQNLSKENEIYQFACGIFERYNHFSKKIDNLEREKAAIEYKQSQGDGYLFDYLKARRAPLLIAINYFLPKLKKIVKNQQQRKLIVLLMVQSCKHVPSREGILKGIRELASVSS